MSKRIIVSAAVAVAFFMSSCGGKSAGVSTASYSDQLAGVCRTINRGIGNLDATASLDDVRGNATEASALYEDGLNELKKLSVPTSDKEFSADVNDLIASFEDQLDSLDAIAKAARENDQEAVDARMSKLSDQAAESNDLADSLNLSRCQLDPVFATVETTPTTEPTVPLTLPIATVPDETVPVETVPLETTPVTGNKVILGSSDLIPGPDYSFVDAPSDAISGFQTLLELAPLMAAQSGSIGGVDVLDSSAQTMGRVFVFVSDTNPLTPGSLDEVSPFFIGAAQTSPTTLSGLDGVTWSDDEGRSNFLVGVGADMLWVFAPSADLLGLTVQDFVLSIPS